ncbi:hypothetical protein XELAEV_18026862mg [Xenopus laevis]|uniref:Uncharacterized protein n=1 Tax=Xenopus laevis TaxID=8355 RepID=A0A974HJE5_XENLA|nr:hypothetical protein XELAEV_18026862mg [Xenopus laevis]
MRPGGDLSRLCLCDVMKAQGGSSGLKSYCTFLSSPASFACLRPNWLARFYIRELSSFMLQNMTLILSL